MLPVLIRKDWLPGLVPIFLYLFLSKFLHLFLLKFIKNAIIKIIPIPIARLLFQGYVQWNKSRSKKKVRTLKEHVISLITNQFILALFFKLFQYKIKGFIYS